MRRIENSLAFALATLALTFAFANAFAQQPTLERTNEDAPQRKSYALTRLGAIYEGVLRDVGSSYIIEFEGGGSTMISKIDALYIGPTRESIFQYKMRETRCEDVNEVLKLADWASRRQLTAEALVLLREKLRVSNDPAEQRALERKINELVEAETFRIDAARLASQRERDDAATLESSSARKNETDASPETTELEEWGAKIPLSVLERFSRKAQPVIQKRCATANCHDSDSDSRYQVRPKTLGKGARLALFHNLRQTLDYVDFDDIERSPILNHPTVLDAKGERVYPFGNDRSSVKDCSLFGEWLESLGKEKILAERVKGTQRPIANTTRPGAASRYDVRRQDDAANEAELFPDDANAERNSNGTLGFGVSSQALRLASRENPDDPNSYEARASRINGAPQKKYRDEYDPAIFNDRFHNK